MDSEYEWIDSTCFFIVLGCFSSHLKLCSKHEWDVLEFLEISFLQFLQVTVLCEELWFSRCFLFFMVLPYSSQLIFDILWTLEMCLLSYGLVWKFSHMLSRVGPPYFELRDQLISIHMFTFTMPYLPTLMENYDLVFNLSA